MSFIIDKCKHNYFFNFSKKTKSSEEEQPVNNQKSQYTFKPSTLPASLIRTFQQNNMPFQQRRISAQENWLILEPISLIFDLQCLIKMITFTSRQLMYIELSLVKNDQSYFSIPNNHCRILLNKLLLQYQSSFQWKLFKININLKNGIVKLFLPLQLIWNLNSLQQQSAHKRKKVFTKIIDYILKITVQAIAFLFRMTNRESYRSKEFTNQQHMLQQKIEQLYRYKQMLFIEHSQFQKNNHLSTERQIRENKMKEQVSIKKMRVNRVKMDQNLSRNTRLYGQYFFRYRQLIEERQYHLTNAEIENIHNMIALPFSQKNRNPNESTLVQNHIFIKNIGQIQLTPHISGGLSTLFLSKISFWSVSSAFNNQNQIPPNYDQKQMIQKFFMIKKQQILSQKRRGRNLHERSIIHKMKNSSSLLLNRYYVSTNKVDGLQNDIIMDYIPLPNFNGYIQMNKKTLSLQIKLYLIFNITQSLRCIKNYSVVHMDLKPSNVLMYCNMFIKLIDFGQSYHPEVCKKGFSPGFTVPYSSPQVYRHCKHFNSKSDVYSLGIIINQLIFEHYPFYFHQNTTLQKYKSSEYLQHWFCSPQDVITYGDPLILSILNQLVSQCLREQPEMRPELNFIAIVLQLCLSILH